MSPCPTSSATQSTLSGFMLEVVQIIQGVSPEWLIYQQEVAICNVTFSLEVIILYYCTTPAPPTPTNVTAEVMSASSFRVAWQWTSSGPAPNCFNTTTVTYHPERDGDSSLDLSDPAATEATLTGLQCNISYTITVVATAGGHMREGVAVLLQGMI